MQDLVDVFRGYRWNYLDRSGMGEMCSLLCARALGNVNSVVYNVNCTGKESHHRKKSTSFGKSASEGGGG